MQLVHDFDAYWRRRAGLGWSHGLSHPVLETCALHPELPAAVVSDGLFTGSRRVPIREFGGVQGANAEIAELTGAEFGDGFARQVADGSFVRDSAATARGVAALRQAYRAVAGAAGLDAESVVAAFASPAAENTARSDVRRAAELGVDGFPTLLAVDGERVTALARGHATTDEVSRRPTALTTVS